MKLNALTLAGEQNSVAYEKMHLIFKKLSKSTDNASKIKSLKSNTAGLDQTVKNSIYHDGWFWIGLKAQQLSRKQE